MITANVSASITRRLRSLAICWSAVIAAGPVTYTFSPGGAVMPSTVAFTASIDSLASDSPWLPAVYT
ncbi:hypothetical protein BN977_03119 [Mycolicibacterium cosmeticum]|uniref:Uncharacterized protein n=1 Tax=Mycolicibacterium cosmeticum TaxID=258533 RepID=W9BKQ3_MYCCO|nr:hypothetical protein BN977_03119 [Mycolicibacterium cosmeticum]